MGADAVGLGIGGMLAKKESKVTLNKKAQFKNIITQNINSKNLQ